MKSERFREVARCVGPRGRRVLAAAVERAIADALVDCPTERSTYASAKRAYARRWALRRVSSCLDEVNFAQPLLDDVAIELCHAFAPIWAAVDASASGVLEPRQRAVLAVRGVADRDAVTRESQEAMYLAVMAELRALFDRSVGETGPEPAFVLPEDARSVAVAEGEDARPYADRWHRSADLEGRARERATVGAYHQFNRLGHGVRQRSKLFGPVARSLPPRVRPLLGMAIERAVADALADAPASTDVTPYAAAARGYARMWAARRVLRGVASFSAGYPRGVSLSTGYPPGASIDLDGAAVADDVGVALCRAFAPIWVGAGASPWR